MTSVLVFFSSPFLSISLKSKSTFWPYWGNNKREKLRTSEEVEEGGSWALNEMTLSLFCRTGRPASPEGHLDR